MRFEFQEVLNREKNFYSKLGTLEGNRFLKPLHEVLELLQHFIFIGFFANLLVSFCRAADFFFPSIKSSLYVMNFYPEKPRRKNLKFDGRAYFYC